MAESSLDRAYTAGLTIVRVRPQDKIVPVTKPDAKKLAFRVVSLVVFAGLIFGALILPVILHNWILEETAREDMASWIAAIVFGAFSVSLGVIAGVYNFLRMFPKVAKEESPAPRHRVHRAIRHAKV